jgi:hypothetical protein
MARSKQYLEVDRAVAKACLVLRQSKTAQPVCIIQSQQRRTAVVGPAIVSTIPRTAASILASLDLLV